MIMRNHGYCYMPIFKITQEPANGNKLGTKMLFYYVYNSKHYLVSKLGQNQNSELGRVRIS